MYVDGNLDKTETEGTVVNFNSTSDATIGTNLRENNSTTGLLDDVRLYNRTLSATEIQEYYQLSQLQYPNILNRTTSNVLTVPQSPLLKFLQHDHFGGGVSL